jgi:TRAP-type C4-dicarboxylate transport system substrate-binding protein
VGIRERSGGRLAIRIFPSSQLRLDANMLSQVRSEPLEFNALSGIILSMLVPVAAISGVGFAFASRE